MHEVRSFDRGVTRHRADAQCAVFDVDGTEFRDTVNVDEHGRPRQPHIDERHEALTAGQYSGVAAALRQQLNCLSNTRGAEIVEGGRHADPVQNRSCSQLAMALSVRSRSSPLPLCGEGRKKWSAPSIHTSCLSVPAVEL